MRQYNELVADILENGSFKPNKRTGIGTKSVFGRQLRFDLSNGYVPVVTSKKTNWKAAYIELLWYLKGSGDISFLHENGIHIWDDWVKPGTTELGPVYGAQWRHWPQFKIEEATDYLHHDGPEGNVSKTFFGAKVKYKEIDQVKQLIDTIKTDPTSRRMIVSAWNPSELDQMQLPPCHMTWQCVVMDGKINLHLLQRSVDVPIGLPFNLVSYSLLTHMVAHVTGYEVGDFVWTGVDVHIYENQISDMQEMLTRPDINFAPTIKFNRKVDDIFDFQPDDIEITNYFPHQFMKIPVAV